MNKQFLLATGLTLGLCFFTPEAQANEIRVGIMMHDVDIPEITKRRIKERSASLTGEYIFDSPRWLKWAGGARPYIYGSANLSGKTSHAGAGLNWRTNLGSKFYAEMGGGRSLHNGTIQIRFLTFEEYLALNTEQRQAQNSQLQHRRNTELQFGSTTLIRGQIALGYKINDVWGADIVYEHLSNGGVFGKKHVNDGLDSVGLRLSRKF